MKSKFLIKIKKLVAGKYFSTFQSIFKGSGLEISDVRQYAAGDPFKYINRKQTAKHNQLYTSLFQQEKDIGLDVFFDVNYNRRGSYSADCRVSRNDGGAETNLEKVVEFFADMMVYCKKNGVRVHIFYPSYSWLPDCAGPWGSNTTIKEIIIDKHRERAYEWIGYLQQSLHRIAKSYRTALPQFLNIAKKNTKKRAIVIFSDFLDIAENDLHVLKHFDKEHALGLVQIPVSLDEGQNYTSFLLDQSKELDSKKLQTIQL